MKKTSVSLHQIENINNINQLSPHYELIINHARMLNNEVYEDIVQDLFLKLDRFFKRYPDKIVNGGFISTSLRNMLRDYHKTNKRRYIDYNVEITDNIISEEHLCYVDLDSDEIAIKLSNEEKYDKIEEMLSELTWIERTVLEYSLIMPVTEMSPLSGIPYQNLIHQLNKAKKKLGVKKI